MIQHKLVVLQIYFNFATMKKITIIIVLITLISQSCVSVYSSRYATGYRYTPRRKVCVVGNTNYWR
jgi:hypothetical protein